MCNEIKAPKYPKLEAKIAETGISNTQLANVLGISVSMLSKRLSGEVDFDLAEIFTLIEHFDCEFNDLFGVVN